MRYPIIVAVIVALAGGFGSGAIAAQQESEPSCDRCPATYVSAEEITEYAFVGRAGAGLTDMQVRSVDVGKSNVQVAVVHRGPLSEERGRNANVASHDLVTEVYYILSGGGTVRTGGELVNSTRRPADNRAVIYLNGPGRNSEDIRNAAINVLKQGDVLVIPAGTGHQWVHIPDHVSYTMVRVDPDKVVPLMDATASRAFLAEQAP